MEREGERLNARIYTEIAPYTAFYLAEDYHQKYYLQSDTYFSSTFKAIYPEPSDFINSTAAARVNGYLAGYGSADNLLQEVDKLGLSPEGSQKLLDMIGR